MRIVRIEMAAAEKPQNGIWKSKVRVKNENDHSSLNSFISAKM